MDDLQLDEIITALAIVIARKNHDERTRWIACLVERVVDEQKNIQHRYGKLAWLRNLRGAIEGMCDAEIEGVSK